MVKSVFSQVHRSEHYYITLINVVHINNKIYILTPYSGYFGKIPGILGSRIIKICANIKLNKVVYFILLYVSVLLLKYLICVLCPPLTKTEFVHKVRKEK